MNLGLTFMTPEELWNLPSVSRPLYPLSFDPKTLPQMVMSLPNISKLSPVELIVMVGFPASGKSTFCEKFLAPLGYSLVSRDLSKSWQKCVTEAEALLRRRLSVAIDNTNVDIESRARYLALAKKLEIPARILHIDTSFGCCHHNEKFRQLTTTNHQSIGAMVFNMMRSKYQEPTATEGFSEILKIPFIPRPPEKHYNLYFQYLLEK